MTRKHTAAGGGRARLKRKRTLSGWPGFVNKDTGCPVKFDFQINNNIRDILTLKKKKKIVVSLKFKFNWASCFVSSNPRPSAPGAKPSPRSQRGAVERERHTAQLGEKH